MLWNVLQLRNGLQGAQRWRREQEDSETTIKVDNRWKATSCTNKMELIILIRIADRARIILPETNLLACLAGGAC